MPARRPSGRRVPEHLRNLERQTENSGQAANCRAFCRSETDFRPAIRCLPRVLPEFPGFPSPFILVLPDRNACKVISANGRGCLDVHFLLARIAWLFAGAGNASCRSGAAMDRRLPGAAWFRWYGRPVYLRVYPPSKLRIRIQHRRAGGALRFGAVRRRTVQSQDTEAAADTASAGVFLQPDYPCSSVPALPAALETRRCVLHGLRGSGREQCECGRRIAMPQSAVWTDSLSRQQVLCWLRRALELIPFLEIRPRLPRRSQNQQCRRRKFGSMAYKVRKGKEYQILPVHPEAHPVKIIRED